MKLEGFGAGLAAGVAIGLVTRSVETSRIAFGPFALYGNGALAVPVILGPVAIFAGWVWLIRRSQWPGPQLVYALATVLGTGLGYGVGMGQPLATLGAIVGLGLFIVPTALLTALTVVILRARRITSTGAIAAVYVGGALIGALPPFAFLGGLGVSGISVGGGIIASERASRSAVLCVGASLLLLSLVQSFALPLLIGPLVGPR